MADNAQQIIPLYRRAPSELLEEWKQEAREHEHTVIEFRRRLRRADPDRRERFRYAIQVVQAHADALRHRISRAESGPLPTQPEEVPEPARLAWQIGR